MLLLAVWPVGGAAAGTGLPVAETGGSASVAEATAKASAGERRCRTLARRRLARVRTDVARGRRPAARRRVRRKLRRCLRQARQADEVGTPQPDETPAPGSPTAPGAPTPPLSSFLGVTASDSDGFRLTLSRPAVAAGLVTFELRNSDSGPHDLVVRPFAGGDEVGRLDQVEPGEVRRKGIELARGDWYLFCSLDGHEATGMHATLRAE